MDFSEAAPEREIASNTTNDCFESKEKKVSKRIQAMKKQEAVRQEFRRGAEAAKSLPAWMQEKQQQQQQAKAAGKKSTSVVAETASNPCSSQNGQVQNRRDP